MNSSPGDRDFRPTASLPVLRLRAEMLDWVRRFFREHGYEEVETPLLSHDVCVDAWIEPFRVPCDGSTSDQPLYLQTSPEFGMKRLLAAGATSIFQITRAFRQEECGRLHNPEFTIVEWYRVGETYRGQMDFVEEFCVGFGEALSEHSKRFIDVSSTPKADASRIRRAGRLPRPFLHMTYADAFARALGQSVLSMDADGLARVALRRQIAAPSSLGDDDRDGWLNLLFVEAVEPMLAEQEAVVVFDYPAGQAALARIHPHDPTVAERFELYLWGIEICNGYQELTDPVELRRRVAVQTQKREREGRPSLPEESRLLEAMDFGLPECAGVALGFDRLLMTLLGASSLDDVVAFPFSRA